MLYISIVIIFIGLLINKLTEKYCFNNLIYKRKISKKVVEINEEVKISTTIENCKILPVSFFSITEKYPSIMKFKNCDDTKKERYIEHKSTMFMFPYQRRTRSVDVKFKKRGMYILSEVTLTVGDFLGKDNYYKNIYYPQDVVVLPKTLDPYENIIPYGNYLGDISVKRWILEDPVINMGIREYSGNEPQRHIHWPSSLRYNKLMVKKYDYTTDFRVMVVVNIECVKPFWADIQADKIESILSLARGIIEKFQKRGIPYGFVGNFLSNGLDNYLNKVYPGCGTSHYNSTLEMLGRADYSVSISFEEVLSDIIKSDYLNTTYIILTPSVLPSYIDILNKLGQKFAKTVLISSNEDNLDSLNRNIISFIEKER